jgi:hypothetical protein
MIAAIRPNFHGVGCAKGTWRFVRLGNGDWLPCTHRCLSPFSTAKVQTRNWVRFAERHPGSELGSFRCARASLVDFVS